MKYSHLYSINEKYINGSSWGTKNFDTKEKAALRNSFLPVEGVSETKYVSSLIPRNVNLGKVLNSYSMFNSQFNNTDTVKSYVFDIETLGSLLPNATFREKELGTISEFALLKFDATKNGSNIIDSNYEKVLNLTFGITQSENVEANTIVSIFEGLLNNDPNYKGMSLTSSELSSLKFFAMYGGEDITQTIKGKNSKGAFFSKNNGVYSIDKHFHPTDELDLNAIKTGIKNLREIGINQGVDTPLGKKMLGSIVNSLNEIKSNNATLFGYNIDHFDIPFLQNFLSKNQSFLGDTSIPNVSEMNTFDVRRAMQVGEAENLARRVWTLQSNKGINTNLVNAGTLSTQAKVRGIEDFEAHVAVDDAPITTNMFFNIQDDGTSLFSDVPKNIESKNKVLIETMPRSGESEYVLKAKKASRIENDGINKGMYDQYLVKNDIGDYVPVEYMSLSTNKDMHYKVDKYGTISKTLLEKAYPEAKFNWETNQDYVYALTLDNASTDRNDRAFIVRESEEEMQKVFNRFEVKQYFPDNQLNLDTAYAVSQGSIDIQTQNKIMDNARRRLASTREPKSGGIKLAKQFNKSYEEINNKYIELTGSSTNLGVDDLNKILNGETDLDKSFITKILDKNFGNSKANKDAFLFGYGKIADEFEVTSNIINMIENIPDNTSNKDAINYYNTLLYNKVLTDIETDSFEYIKNLQVLNGEIDEKEIVKVANSVSKNQRVAGISEIGYDHIDLLNPIGANTNKRAFDKLPVNEKYFGVTASHYEDISYSILNKTKEVGINSPTKLTSNQVLNKKKSYLKALTKDLYKRGVINKETNLWYKEVISSIESDDGVFQISSQIGGDLMNVVEKAKDNLSKEDLKLRTNSKKIPVGKNYKGLIKKDLNLNIIDSNKVYGSSYSEYVNNILYNNNLEEKVMSSIKEYRNFSNINFIDNNINEDNFLNTGAARWLKDNFGYTDENIETLQSALYGRNGIVKNSEDGLGLSAYLFTMKDKRGNDMPALGIAKRGTTIEFSPNKLPDNMSYMILPKLDTSRNYYDHVTNTVRPGIVRLGDVDKINSKELNVYSYIDSYGSKVTKATNRDLVSRAISTLTMRKNDIKKMIENGEYNALTTSLNSTSKRIQLNAKGVSQRLIRTGEDGNKFAQHVLNKLDVDNINTINADQIIKMIPILYDQTDSPIKTNMQNSFKNGLADKHIRSIENLIKSNKAFTMEDLSPELVEWMYKNSYTENGIIAESYKFFKDVDKKSAKAFKELLSGHSIIKDSNMTSFLISMSPGVKANQLGQFSAFTRPVQNQSRGAIPFMLDDFDYKSYEDSFGINFGNFITSNTDLETYSKTMNKQGLNVATGFVGDIKQMKTGDAYLAFQKARENGENVISAINTRYGTNYTTKDLNTALDVLESRTSFFEGGGLFKPGLDSFIETEQIYSMEVGESYFKSINQGDVIKSGEFLGQNRKGRKLSYKGENVVVLGKEEIGYDVEGLLDKEKQFKVSYKFEKPTNPGVIKMSTFGGNEKGVFTTLDLGSEKSLLARGLFEEIFGQNVVAVSSSELFKHDSYGGILASYINTIAKEAYDFDNINNTNHLYDFVDVLNKEMPSMGYKINIDPNTNRKVITHLNANEVVNNTNNPFEAMKNVINHYRNSDDEFSKKVISQIEYMDKEKIFKTDFNQMFLTDSYAENAKFNNKMVQLASITSGKEGSKNTRLQHRLAMRGTKEYQEGQRMLSNIYATVQRSMGNEVGVVEELNVKDFHFPGYDPTYEDIKNSKLFDFEGTNKYGAKINTYKINLPEGLTVKTPFLNEAVNELYLPLVKTYHLDNQIMLSKLQMAEENLMLSLNKYMENPLEVGSRDYVQRKVDEIYKSMEKELTHKDGIKSKMMESIKYDTGGMEIIAKMQAPEFEFELDGKTLYNAPLDDKGNLVKGTKIKGFLDKSANDILRFDKNGDVNGVYEVIKYSKEALENKGVNFKTIGTQILEGLEVEKEFLPTIAKAKEDIAMANIVLEAAKMSNEDKAMNQMINRIEEIHEELGIKYFTQVGVFQEGGRHPVMGKTSLGVQKVKLDPNQKGRTMIGNYVTILKKWFGDVDSDQGVGKLIGIDNNGEYNLIPTTSQMYKTAQDTYEISARQNVDYLIKGAESYAQDFNEDKFIHYGNKLSPLDLAEKKALASLGEDIVNNNFNLYQSDFHIALATKARAMKLAVPTPSIANYNLREIAEHLYGADINNKSFNDILDLTRLVEQNIISLKHVKDLGGAMDITPVERYSEGIRLMSKHNANTDQFIKGFDEVVDVFNKLKLFGKDTDYVTSDVLNGSIPYDELPTDVHKQLYTLKELLSDNDASKMYGKVMTSSDPDDMKYKNFLSQVYSDDNIFINSESGQNVKKIIQDSMDLQYLDIDGKQLGVGSHIEASGYEPYKIVDIIKNPREGFDKVVLEDLYSKEQTSIIGSSFKDISKEIEDLGFKYTDNPIKTTLDSEDFFNKRFASYDDFVRETIIEDTIGAFSNQDINKDKALFLEAVSEQFDKFGLNKEQQGLMLQEMKSLSSEDKKLYRKSYATKTKDVYFETENLINELRLTNTMTQNDVLEKAKSYYSTTSDELIEEMNYGIRQRAIQAKKKKVYDLVDEKYYSNLDTYMEIYKNKSSQNKLGFKGTTAIRSQRKASLVNESLSGKTFEQLGDIKVNLGNGDIYLKEANIEEIVNVALQNTEKSKIVSKETQEIAKHYLSKIDLSNSNQSSLLQESRLRGVANTVVDSQNDVIREMAKKTTKKTNTNLVSKAIDYVKANKVKSAIFAGATIGLASAVTGMVNKNSALVPKNNANEEKVDSKYASRDSIKDIAPDSNKTVIVQSPNTTKGANYNISTLNKGRASNDGMLRSLRNLIGDNSTLRYKEEREEKQINESWLKEKMSDLF